MDKISLFENDFHELMDAKYSDVLKALAAGELNDDITKRMELAAREVALKYIDRKSEE
jgi:hypothetical protein